MYLLIYFHCKLFSSVFEFSQKKALKICIIIIIINSNYTVFDMLLKNTLDVALVIHLMINHRFIR